MTVMTCTKWSARRQRRALEHPVGPIRAVQAGPHVHQHRVGEAGAAIAVIVAHPREWSHTFTDPRLAAAVVDRLTFKAHIIETGTDSYRLRASRGKQRPPAKPNGKTPADPDGKET